VALGIRCLQNVLEPDDDVHTTAASVKDRRSTEGSFRRQRVTSMFRGVEAPLALGGRDAPCAGPTMAVVAASDLFSRARRIYAVMTRGPGRVPGAVRFTALPDLTKYLTT
jgi:hypothetical protein